ncbi:hypothetical protein K466DRAFT_571081 [Polyporus arcularius HHB13444]|uniref:Uncharacterized protein n=1 Tax=Polyporus arcularius HHB13444 TaxID=1314778 RepID=A0A5C3NLG8_9APHY|nr:hypothetical protein K466DRAFT_571081 [Polyporus arcularius HHB13444]
MYHIDSVPPDQYDTYDVHVTGRVVEIGQENAEGSTNESTGIVTKMMKILNECQGSMVEEVTLEVLIEARDCGEPGRKDRRNRKRKRGAVTSAEMTRKRARRGDLSTSRQRECRGTRSIARQKKDDGDHHEGVCGDDDYETGDRDGDERCSLERGDGEKVERQVSERGAEGLDRAGLARGTRDNERPVEKHLELMSSIRPWPIGNAQLCGGKDCYLAPPCTP